MGKEINDKKGISVAKLVKPAKPVICVVVCIALYLNIGWALGTYYHHNIMYQKPQTLVQTIAAGGWEFFSSPEKSGSLISDQIFWALFWPLWLFEGAVMWLLQGVYYLCWLVFAGGIAKLLGVG